MSTSRVRIPASTSPLHPARGRRVLVVANDAAGVADVPALFGAAPGAIADVTVVAPSLNSWSGHLVCDAAGAERDAIARMETTVTSIRSCGIGACGIVGDADPLLATLDALTVAAADEVVVATAPPRLDGWLGEILAARLRPHCAVPVRTAAVVFEPEPAGHRPLAAA